MKNRDSHQKKSLERSMTLIHEEEEDERWHPHNDHGWSVVFSCRRCHCGGYLIGGKKKPNASINGDLCMLVSPFFALSLWSHWCGVGVLCRRGGQIGYTESPTTLLTSSVSFSLCVVVSLFFSLRIAVTSDWDWEFEERW